MYLSFTILLLIVDLLILFGRKFCFLRQFILIDIILCPTHHYSWNDKNLILLLYFYNEKVLAWLKFSISQHIQWNHLMLASFFLSLNKDFFLYILSLKIILFSQVNSQKFIQIFKVLFSDMNKIFRSYENIYKLLCLLGFSTVYNLMFVNLIFWFICLNWVFPHSWENSFSKLFAKNAYDEKIVTNIWIYQTIYQLYLWPNYLLTYDEKQVWVLSPAFFRNMEVENFISKRIHIPIT